MKFLDSNVVVYAFFVPRRQLSLEEQQLKQKSKKIIEKIDAGEKVAISVVHLSEIANVLRTCFAASDLVSLFESFYTKENMIILGVSQSEYLEAIHLSKSLNGKVNDCLAAVLMKKNKMTEMYTFDADFKNFSWMKIVRE
mgnify:FL=1